MEIGQEPTMFTPNDDITDMSNKTLLLATGCTQMVSIHDIISGKIPFPHLNNTKNSHQQFLGSKHRYKMKQIPSYQHQHQREAIQRLCPSTQLNKSKHPRKQQYLNQTWQHNN
jgi:hypothetical protein